MNAKAVPAAIVSAVVQRFSALVSPGPDDLSALHHAASERRRVAPRREIGVAGEPVGPASIILSGWACRARHFADGRLQVLGLLLPGELVGHCAHRQPLAATTIVAVTEVVLCPTPRGTGSSALPDFYALSSALEEFYLYRQIARLGQLSAFERTIDWLLETHDRLSLCGLIQKDMFPMPLTQQLTSDLLGITSVHLNRTFQTLRRENLLEMGRGTVNLLDRPRMESLVDYLPARITFAGET